MRRDETGATAVEFALVVPLFFTLLAITGYFAWNVFTESQLNRAAQRAARYAAVPTTDGDYAYGQCAVLDKVNDQLGTFTVTSADVVLSDRRGTVASATCPGGPSPSAPRGYVHVHVRHELDNPFSDALTFLLRRPAPFVITGNGEARVEDTT